VSGDGTNGWRLGRRERVSVGEVAYEVFGEGRLVILAHGTPTRSYLWRTVAPTPSLKMLSGVGHFVPEDAPEEIAKELVTFFSGEDEQI
jgi:hypothetical protein